MQNSEEAKGNAVVGNGAEQGIESGTERTGLAQRVREGMARGVLELQNKVIEFETKELFKGKVRIRLPKELAPVEPKEDNNPPGYGIPVSFSNGRGTVTADFNHTATPLNEQRLGQFKDYMIQGLQRKEPEVEILRQGTEKVRGRSVAYFEFVTPDHAGGDYSLMFMAELEERALVVSFTGQKRKISIWGPVAHGIMESMELVPPAQEEE